MLAVSVCGSIPIVQQLLPRTLRKTICVSMADLASCVIFGLVIGGIVGIELTVRRAALFTPTEVRHGAWWPWPLRTMAGGLTAKLFRLHPFNRNSIGNDFSNPAWSAVV